MDHQKLCTILIISSLFISCTNAISKKPQPEDNEEDEWAERYLSQPKEKLAKFRFYVQDAIGGPNSTVWEVARSVNTSRSPTLFGLTVVLDDVITAGPDRNSMKLGRAQGSIAFGDMNELGFVMYLNFYFTAGPYSGSTLTMLGRNQILAKKRELPLVGGTGRFRMARGYAIAKTYSNDAVENYSVFEYTFYVFYV